MGRLTQQVVHSCLCGAWRILRALGYRVPIYYINGPDTLPAPLSQADEAAAFAALERQEEAAKQTLIVHNLRLVVYIARKFESTGIGVEAQVTKIICKISLGEAVTGYETGEPQWPDDKE